MPLLCFHGYSCCSRGIGPAHYFLILPGRMGGTGAVGWFCLHAGPDPSPDMQMSFEKEAVLGIQPQAVHELSQCSTTEPPFPFSF